MIEFFITLMAFFGFSEGEGDKPLYTYEKPEQEMIRAIDSDALKGFDRLETHDANEWFV